MTVATGLEEHRNYAVDFIEADPLDQSKSARRACQRRREQYFVFISRQQHRARSDARGFSVSRDRAGLDMGIVNAGQLAVYEEIEPELRERVEDVLAESPRRRHRAVGRFRRTRKSERQGRQ